MLVPAVLLAFAAFAGGASPRIRPSVPILDGRIVGGAETTIENFPHQLSLEYRGTHTCGASVLSETRALTAAFCTDKVDVTALTVRAGSSRRHSGGVIVGVAEVYQHSRYNDRWLDYDVSVLVLKDALSFSESIKPIALHGVGEELATGAEATVTGWGKQCSTCVFSDTLQMVAVPKVSHEQCQEFYDDITITPRMTCHGYKKGGKDTCDGDTGGPLVANNVQVGISSWGYGCAKPFYPGVYTRIANFEVQDYIKEHL